ncbi:MAG: hypothetical protein IPM64_17455 [Phycisphaerales bacterium]|nr:hypothetical protein [Phycisphaerales bacterium]
MITDAQFSAWLATDAQRILLAEVDYAYESGGAPATGTLYLSRGGYSTRETDSPAHTAYRDAILGMPKFSRRINVPSLGGRSEFSISALDLANTDGLLDFMSEIAIDGQEVRFYLGASGWERTDFRAVLVAVSEYVDGNDDVVRLHLRDKRLLLDREIKGDPVGGSGTEATKYLPLLWGSHQNVPAFLYDSSALIYSVVSNYNAGSVVAVVRDAGASLRDSSGGWTATSANTTADAGTDLITKTAHGLEVNDVIFFADPVIVGGTYLYWPPFPGMSARPYWVKSVPTADTFSLSATKGGATLDITGATWSDSGSGALIVVRQFFFDDLAATGRIQLKSTPAGLVTADLLNRENITAPFALAEEIITDYGNLDAGEIDSAAFTAADVALDAKIALGYSNFAVYERRNILAALDELVAACMGWYGQARVGTITCGLIDPSGLASAAADHELGVSQLKAGISISNIPPTVSRVNVLYDMNAVAQPNGLVTSLTAAQLRTYAELHRKVQRSTAPTGTAYSGNKPLYHKTMTEGAPRTAGVMNTTAFGTDAARPISNYADEIVEDYRPHLQVVDVQATIDAYEWELGEVVLLTYPRYGFEGGKNCRIVGIDVDLDAETLGLSLLTYSAPDTTTASYP